MAYRRRDQKGVARLHEPVLTDLPQQCMQRIMAVQHTLGSSCCAGSVHQHPDIVGRHRRRNRRSIFTEQTGIFRQFASEPANNHDFGRCIHSRDHSTQHIGIIIAPKLVRNKNHPCAGIGQNEPQIMVA